MCTSTYQESSNAGNQVVYKPSNYVHRYYTSDKAVNYSWHVLAVIKSEGILQKKCRGDDGRARIGAAVSHRDSARITASTECQDSSIRIYRLRLPRVPGARRYRLAIIYGQHSTSGGNKMADNTTGGYILLRHFRFPRIGDFPILQTVRACEKLQEIR